MNGWIGVDLDGTLAVSVGLHKPGEIGKPIPEMLDRVKRLIGHGETIKIFTARVSSSSPGAHIERVAIREWTRAHVGRPLEVTAEKDYEMKLLLDDRAITIEHNTGAILVREYVGL